MYKQITKQNKIANNYQTETILCTYNQSSHANPFFFFFLGGGGAHGAPPRLEYTEWITRSFVNKAKEGGHVRMLFKTYCGIDYHYCLNLLNSFCN